VTVLASFRTLSWRLLLVVVFPFGLITMLDTLGWRFAFRRDLAPFATLYSVRLAGEAVNIATPTASLGGEPVKAYLLRPRIPMEEALASVIVGKTTITLAQGCFLAVGLAVAWALLPLPGAVLHGMSGLLAIEALALAGFVMVQLWGIFGGGLRLFQTLGIAWGRRRADQLHQLDRAVAAFYRDHHRRLGFSVLFHFLGWMLGSFEVYLILLFIGMPVPLVTALVIDAFAAGIKFAAFLLPGGLGALEGGNMAIFTAMGLGAGIGLSFTLIRRLRELIWATAGFLLLSVLQTSVAAE
jgi:uncharacterized membrane protein YbhN (UPF0104 family)